MNMQFIQTAKAQKKVSHLMSKLAKAKENIIFHPLHGLKLKFSTTSAT